MAIYRFRVIFEEYEEIIRTIEIKSTQTFKEFHTAILESIKFDTKHAASFFVSDDYWRKNQEITLLEEDKEADTKMMKDTKIASMIETPYQRFIYIYDKVAQWTFMIELLKIDVEQSKTQYPQCSRSQGHAPKQYKQDIIDAAEKATKQKDPLAMLLGGGLEDEEEDELEEEAYKNAPDTEMGLNEGDLDFAPGEEGEEEDKTSEDGEDGGEDQEEGEDYGFGEEHHDD